MIQLNVVNKGLQVGIIRILGVASSSVVLVGDTEVVTASSVYDQTPELTPLGPLVPFGALSPAEAAVE